MASHINSCPCSERDHEAGVSLPLSEVGPVPRCTWDSPCLSLFILSICIFRLNFPENRVQACLLFQDKIYFGILDFIQDYTNAFFWVGWKDIPNGAQGFTMAFSSSITPGGARDTWELAMTPQLSQREWKHSAEMLALTLSPGQHHPYLWSFSRLGSIVQFVLQLLCLVYLFHSLDKILLVRIPKLALLSLSFILDPLGLVPLLTPCGCSTQQTVNSCLSPLALQSFLWTHNSCTASQRIRLAVQ